MLGPPGFQFGRKKIYFENIDTFIEFSRLQVPSGK